VNIVEDVRSNRAWIDDDIILPEKSIDAIKAYELLSHERKMEIMKFLQTHHFNEAEKEFNQPRVTIEFIGGDFRRLRRRYEQLQATTTYDGLLDFSEKKYVREEKSKYIQIDDVSEELSEEIRLFIGN